MVTKNTPVFVNNCGTTKTTPTNGFTITATGTTGSWASAPTNVPHILSTTPTFFRMELSVGTSSFEVVYVITHGTGSTSCTVVRGREGTSAVAHTSATWVHANTAADAAVVTDLVLLQLALS